MTITPYTRRRKPAPQPAAYEVRLLTDHERWLDSFAQKDGFAGLVTIWRQGADGYTGFEALMPETGIIATVGTVSKHT